MLGEINKQFAGEAEHGPQSAAINGIAQSVDGWNDQLRAELEALGAPQTPRQMAYYQYLSSLSQMCGAFVGGLMTATFNYAVRLHEADLEDSARLLVELRRNVRRHSNGRPPTHD